MTDTASTIKIHKRFSAEDADITVQSSDGVVFKLHRQNLGMNTGAFPGTEIATEGKIVYLTETGKVLGIVFQFIYPKKHPKLQDVNFDTLLEVAEAVEKYEVFSAMNLCEIRLHDYPEGKAGKVFIHALKHDYHELINKTALSFCRYRGLDLIKVLPSHCVIPWLEYIQTWDKIFNDMVEYIELLKSAPDCTITTVTSKKSGTKIVVRTICDVCRLTLICHITNLAKIDDLQSLKNAIESPLLLGPKIGKYGMWCDSCSKGVCGTHLPLIKRSIQDRIASMPPFTHFLKAKGSTSSAK